MTNRKKRGVDMQKIAGAAVAAVLTVGALGVGAVEVSAATAKALPTGKFHISTVPAQKKESGEKFKATKTGKIQFTLTKKQYDHSIGVRLITCGGDWKSLTDWKEFKKEYGDYYTFDKKVKEGTCFRIQSGRSWAGNIDGKVKGHLKRA
ncbi:hypothetical protein ACFCYF_37410 [Streptomyces chartreusis]|uniref:hypothetical protein n=1 Tax=Streptomyces chartreusis TaxID=1969 RepID=UPI002E808761|nr:hypothetical protein [Streptomyces chartreusis]WUB20690.1 hypothetical protein OG997_30040 [Streptomyces chartreusis]